MRSVETFVRFLSARAICGAVLAVLFFSPAAPLAKQMLAQTAGQKPAGEAAAQPGAPLVSEDATASVEIAGGTIDIRYNTPHMRGRKIMGALVPYGQVWRTGANPATTLITSVPLKFGDLLVPAGTRTIYSLPSADAWQLIINNQTGQWGTVYTQSMDLGRIPMKAAPMSAPQEVMSLSFEHSMANSTELHVRWETTDRYVTITKP